MKHIGTKQTLTSATEKPNGYVPSETGKIIHDHRGKEKHARINLLRNALAIHLNLDIATFTREEVLAHVLTEVESWAFYHKKPYLTVMLAPVTTQGLLNGSLRRSKTPHELIQSMTNTLIVAGLDILDETTHKHV